MKKFSEFRVGDKFYSTCSISEDELDEYFNFSRVKNAFLEDYGSKKQQMVSGRAALSRMEGEFTRLNQIYGNRYILPNFFKKSDAAVALGRVLLKKLSCNDIK